jgi:hypothetical protein
MDWWEGFYTPTGLRPRSLSGRKAPPTPSFFVIFVAMARIVHTGEWLPGGFGWRGSRSRTHTQPGIVRISGRHSGP